MDVATKVYRRAGNGKRRTRHKTNIDHGNMSRPGCVINTARIIARTVLIECYRRVTNMKGNCFSQRRSIETFCEGKTQWVGRRGGCTVGCSQPTEERSHETRPKINKTRATTVRTYRRTTTGAFDRLNTTPVGTSQFLPSCYCACGSWECLICFFRPNLVNIIPSILRCTLENDHSAIFQH